MLLNTLVLTKIEQTLVLSKIQDGQQIGGGELGLETKQLEAIVCL